ncbi:MAG TPA: hypothetical protein ACFYD3_09605 [Candidatus Hypogeohydataceae bacterium YC41]
MEIAFEALSLVTGITALVFLLIAKSGKSIQPAIVTLYLCIGFNVAEIVTRRFLKLQITAKSATLDTVTVAMAVTALCYVMRSRKRVNKSAPSGLGFAILCNVWIVTIFALELILRFVLGRLGAL